MEGTREMRTAVWLEVLSQDVRLALRTPRQFPAFTAIVVITIALGIGVNTAIFSVLNGSLLRPLPVRAPEQLTVLAFSQQHDGSNFSYPDLLDFRHQSSIGFSDLFAYGLSVAGLSANGHATEFAYSSVTGNYFSALGLRPTIGRFFYSGEGETPGEASLVVLGNSYWRKNFNADPSTVGKQVLVNGKTATIVGVAPPEFHGTLFAFDMDGFLTLNAMAEDSTPTRFWTDRHDRRLVVLGRLQPGVTVRQAESSANTIAQRLAAQYPSTNSGVTVRVIPESYARPAVLVSSFVPAIAGLFLALAALVLLLACLNVANLLFARATARRRELAIRSALGAGRAHLIRQLLTESLFLALIGGVAGVFFGEWAISASGSALHSVTTTSNFAYRLDCSLDWRVFFYALSATILTGVLAGLWPALRVGRAGADAVLNTSARSGAAAGRQKLRSALVVVQVAGSLVLLIVAGLFVRSLQHAEQMSLGFEPDHVLNVILDPHQMGYDDNRAKAFYRQLEDGVGSLPGVRSASLAFTVPLALPAHATPVYIEGRPLTSREQPPQISFNSVDPNYFATMRIPVLQGRAFAHSDSEFSPQVAIVNQTMAEKFWPNESPIGKAFRKDGPSGSFIEIVGMARDGQYFFISPDPQPYFYVPLAQNFTSFLSLQVRTSLPPESLLPTLQQQIRSIAPNLPVIDARTMPQIIQGFGGFFVFRLAASLAAALGLMGLSLSVIGVYGIISFGLAQRTQEMGIRIALGAARADILKLALGQGLALVVCGVLAGFVIAWGFTRAMTKLLLGVTNSDPSTYAIAALTLVAVALLACYVPARRAMRVAPMVALRYE
jgi:putative ABC transport system permease protein